MYFFDDKTAAEDILLAPVHVRGDRLMTIVCWALWLLSLVYAAVFHEWYTWLIGASVLAVAGSALTTFAPGQLGTRMGIAVIFMLFCALLIDQSHGMIESHFSIFTLLAFLLYYRDVRPLVAGLIVTGSHHVAFCWMQMQGYDVEVFPPGHPCAMVWVHVGYVVFEVTVLMLLAIAIRGEALEAAAFARLGTRLSDEGVIDLTDASAHFLGEGSPGVAARGLPQFLSVLQGAVTRAGTVAGGIGTVSGEMTEAALHLVKAGRTQQISAGDVVATAERMDAAVDEMSLHCNEVAQMVRGSSTLVAEGRASMHEAVAHMDTLVESVDGVSQAITRMQRESARIEEIIRIIEESADRTSLLALNAAIEAGARGRDGARLRGGGAGGEGAFGADAWIATGGQGCGGGGEGENGADWPDGGCVPGGGYPRGWTSECCELVAGECDSAASPGGGPNRTSDGRSSAAEKSNLRGDAADAVDQVCGDEPSWRFGSDR